MRCAWVALSCGPHATRGPTNITWSINTLISKEASRRGRIASRNVLLLSPTRISPHASDTFLSPCPSTLRTLIISIIRDVLSGSTDDAGDVAGDVAGLGAIRVILGRFAGTLKSLYAYSRAFTLPPKPD